MNIRVTIRRTEDRSAIFDHAAGRSVQRRLAAAVALACTLAGAVSPALAQGQSGLALMPYGIQSGVWFRPHGSGIVILAAPINPFVPLLPPYYSMGWIGGSPYYANNGYTMWTSDPNAYEVVSPPPGAPEPVVNGDQPYAYPLEDQSPEQQARDRHECNAWATDQTGFDPSQSGDDMTATLTAYYNLALTACLKQRGYNVE